MAFSGLRSALLHRVPLCVAAAAGGSAAVSCATAGRRSRLEEELAKLRPNEAAMREKWIQDDQESWKKLPPRAWPARQPGADQIPELRAGLEQERCPPPGSQMSADCITKHFDLATAMVFNSVDAADGVATYRKLGEAGSLDGMVATGVCHVENLGVPRNDEEGITWLRMASEKGSAQGHFELGMLVYMGGAGLEEDEPAAFELFKQAAEQRHSSGMFMVGDCLLEGIGCERDQAAAIPLLKAAADMGHRGARQHLRQLLDGNWAGFIDQATRNCWQGQDLPHSAK